MSEPVDYLVIGAGPAGLQLGYFLARSERTYAILEREDRPGSFFEKYPRDRELISFNKVHSIYDDPEILLRWDWNSLLTDDYSFPFKEYSKQLYPHADDLVRYLRDFARHFEIDITYGFDVSRVSRRKDGVFVATDADGREIAGKILIVATGLDNAYIPPIPGIEHCEGYEDVSYDPEDYVGQRVLVIGKGNSGFEFADQILDTASIVHLASPQPVTMAWKTRFAGNLRANNSRLLDMYQLKLLNGALDCEVVSIEKHEDVYHVTVSYVHADGEEETLVFDRVIRAAGFRFNPSIFDESCKPVMRLHGRLPDMGPKWQSTNTPNLYFAGTLTQIRDFRVSASAFIDGFRYNCRTLFHILEEEHFGVRIPHETHPLRTEELVRLVTDRVCRSSALWTQFKFLCDAIVFDRDNQTFSYFYELPVDYMHTIPDQEGRFEYYLVSFEWGEWDGDVFEVERHPRAETAYTNVFLHPIVRRFNRGVLVAEHHILEDLFGTYSAAGESGIVLKRGGREIDRYHREEHHEPLTKFFDEQLALPPGGAYLRESEHPSME